MEQDIYKQVEEAKIFFESMLDKFNKICVKHRMYLTRFEHEGPCWTLRGIHPKGGDVAIAVYYKMNGNTDLSIYWGKPSYETKKIYSKSKKTFLGRVDEKNIEILLEKAVKELLEMKEGNWEKEIEYPEWSEKFKNKDEWIKVYGLDLPPIE